MSVSNDSTPKATRGRWVDIWYRRRAFGRPFSSLATNCRTKDVADFAEMVLEHLMTAGVQQAHKEDRITFTSISGWPGRFICAEGRYVEVTVPTRVGGF